MKIFMYTHHTLHKPKTKANTIANILLGFVLLLYACMLLIVSIAGFLDAHSAGPALIAWGSALLILILLFPIFMDMSRAYIEVSEQAVLVVTYKHLFGLRREKYIKKQDIASAWITTPRRYLASLPLCISLYDCSDRFLFEVCYCRESLECFQSYLQDQSLPPLP